MFRLLILIPAIVWSTFPVQQESGTADQNTRRLARIAQNLREAGALYKEEDFEGSAKKITAAQALLARAAQVVDEDMRKVLEKEHRRIAKAHRLLTEKGIELPALLPLPVPGMPIDGGGNSEPVADGTIDDSSANLISFQNEVAPLLARHCGTCHVRGSRGKYNLGTFEKLMGKSPGGQPVVPGNPGESLLVQLIESQEMPPRGSVAKDDIDLIRDWIQQGARFDGADERAPIGGGQGPRNNR